jgi:hypothetical protein
MARPEHILSVAAVLAAVLAFPVAAQNRAPTPEERAVESAMRTGSYEQAFGLLEKMAKTGNAEAQYQLSSLFRNGRGVARDDSGAFYWMSQAANSGMAKAQYALGQMYLAGVGVQANRKEAEAWLRRAAQGGHRKAAELLARLPAADTATGPLAANPSAGWDATVTTRPAAGPSHALEPSRPVERRAGAGEQRRRSRRPRCRRQHRAGAGGRGGQRTGRRHPSGGGRPD